MGRLNPEKKSEIFNSNSKTRFRMYKAGKRWLVAGTATLAGLFGASIAQGSSVKADTSAGVAKEASQETLATAKTGTIPAASTTASTSASQSTSTSLSQSTSAVASASAASSLSQSTSAVASASAQASTSLSQSTSAVNSAAASTSLSQSTSAANSAQASQSANTDQQANSHVAIQLFAASAPSTAASSTVANSQATTSTVVTSTTSASTTNSEGSLASNQVAATLAFDADTLKAVLAQLPTGTTAEVLNGVTVFTLPVDTTAAVIKQAQDTIIAAKPAGPVQVKAMAATATTTLTASEQIAHDVMHDAVGTLTTQTTFGLLNSFSQIADLINMYDPTTKTFKFDAAAMATLQNDKLISGNGGEDTTGLFGQTNHWDIPPINTTSQVWLDPNGKFYSSDQKDWLGRPTGYRTLLTAQQVQDLWNVGVASFLQPYVQGLIDYQQQIANALDPTKTPDAAKNQAALMAMSDYRAGDMTSDGSNFASIISGVLGGSTVDQLVPAVFGNNNLVTGDAATAFNNTWSGLNKLLKVIISTIQNSIVHQALGDIRSLGLADGYMTNGLSNYVPASLQGAINQNNTLRTIVNTIGMESATTASYTNSVYQALANGITSAVLRNANYGIETALAAMDITPVNQLKADGDTIYTPTQMGQLATFNPTDPTSAMGHNQTAANWSLLMQSAGYSWMNKIAAPLAQLAMSDVVGDGAGHSTIETSTAAILKTLVANGTIKQSDADLINNSLGTTADSWAKNADMANYQRPGQGASDFILGLYNAEVKAYQTAATDYIKAPNATTLNTPIFINPGDPNAIGKGTATASNSVNYQILAYNKVYKWLQDSDAAFKASEAADTAANTQIKTVAKGSAISITPADSMPNTITGGTSLFGAAGLDATKADFKPLTDPTSVLGKNGVNWLNNQLTAAYIASYNSEATRATDAFTAGQQAAKDAATAANGYAIPDPAKRDDVPSSTNYSVSDDTTAQVTSMKGGTISHTTGDIYYAGYQNQATTFRVNYTVAKGTSKQLLATDFPTSAGYIAYTDANGNPAFYKLFNTAIGTNVVEDPVSSNGLTAGDSQSLVATNVDSSNVINFVYSNNLVSQGAVLNGQPITTPYDGQTASSHASGKLSVTLNFKDSQTGSAANYGPYDLVEGDYVVTGDSSKVGKYTVTLTDQGRQKIEAALTAAGASVQNVDDQLKGLTGTITIQDSVAGLSQVTSANQTINVGDAVPSQSAFFPTILDSKGNSISIDDVTISGLPTGSPQAGMYIVTLTVTDPISGQVTTKQAILNVLDPINSQLNSQIQASTSAAASVAASEAASTAASMSTALSQANSTASAANSATSDANSTASTANSAASELASQASARESASTSAMMSEHNSQYISEQTSADMSNFISQEISNATSAGTSAAASDGYNASDASNAGSAVGSQVGSVADSLISSQSTSISESARESNIGSIAASQAASDGISDESSLTSIYNSAANSAQSQYNSVIESNSASTQLSNSISQSNSAVVSQASAANSALSQLSEIASRSDSAVASASSQASAANSVASAASELQSAASASNSAAVSEAISNAESQASAAGSTSEQISAAGSTAASEKTSEIASNASSTAASQTASQAGSVAESQAVSAGSTDSQASAAGSIAASQAASVTASQLASASVAASEVTSAMNSQNSVINSYASQASVAESQSNSAIASASSQASAANSVASAASELQSAASASNSAAVSEAISNAESQASAAGSTSEQISAAGSTAASEKTSEIASNASSTAASQTASQAGSVAASQAISAGSTSEEANSAASTAASQAASATASQLASASVAASEVTSALNSQNSAIASQNSQLSAANSATSHAISVANSQAASVASDNSTLLSQASSTVNSASTDASQTGSIASENSVIASQAVSTALSQAASTGYDSSVAASQAVSTAVSDAASTASQNSTLLSQANSTTSAASTAASQMASTASQNSTLASEAVSTAMSQAASAAQSTSNGNGGGSNPGNGGNGTGSNPGNGNNGGGNGTGNLPGTGGSQLPGSELLHDAVATIVQHSTDVEVYDKPNGTGTGKMLPESTDWKAYEKYTDANGVVWYNLGGNQWVKGTGIILDAKPGSYKELKTIGVVTQGSGVPVYTLPGVSGKATGQILKPGTAWKISASVITSDGQLWYRVGTNQWVKATDITIGNIQAMNDVAVINYVPGYGINVWADANGTKFTGKRLQTGSAWKVFAKATAANGHVFYNVGGNQWIDSANVILGSKPASKPVQKNTTTIKYVPGYSIKTWQSPTSKVSGKSLANGATVTVSASEIVNNELWYQVGPNQWINAKYTNELR